MNASVLGAQMARWRREAGLTQIQLAERMATKQSVISRVEAGGSLPTLSFLERFAKATGRTQLVLSFDEPARKIPTGERRRRVRKVLGSYVFNPWDRNPTSAEARTLVADGLTRERFQREVPVGPGRCRIIGIDDLYLDRLRQATIDERQEGVEFQSALAVVAARYEDIDWNYVRRRLSDVHRTEGPLADSMKRIDSRIRRRVRRALAEPT